MKTAMFVTALALGMGAAIGIMAQDAQPQHPQGGPGGQPRPSPRPPVLVLFDVNKDGVIDAQEIANASHALVQLDKNGDGQLTVDELRAPRRPQGGGKPRKPRPEPEAAPQ
jgi:hypothetical protein